MALRRHAIERPIDDLLDARAHVLHPPRGEGLHHQAAQAGVIGRVLLQHPVAHAAVHRLVEDVSAVPPRHSADEVLAEAPFAQHEADIVVTAGDEEAERRAMDGIARAQIVVVRVGVTDELRRQRIEVRLGTRGLQHLVHDASPGWPQRPPADMPTGPHLVSRPNITNPALKYQTWGYQAA